MTPQLQHGSAGIMPDSPFEFADTASARQQTTDLAMKLKDERVAIVGVGGTGSFVLDFVAKTWVKEIHLFDGDDFLQHNAFRAPGAYTRAHLSEAHNKATFHGRRYAHMHRGVVIHSIPVDELNVHHLGDFDTVFLCVDGGSMKEAILQTCISHGVLFIDCGMGVKRTLESRLLIGTIRVTTCSREHYKHARNSIDFSGVDDGDNEYERNAQMAELNALNAALAVIKWKKIRGIYADFGCELHCLYAIDGNKLINRYEDQT